VAADPAARKASPPVARLKRRAEFKAVAGGRRVSKQGFVLQALKAPPDEGARPPRFGFTVTKKTGNAVVRNRIRRRLREVARFAAGAEKGTDYVLIGRRAALGLEFERLIADLRSGFTALSNGPEAEDKHRR
jgi:ribonuclease P protein component